jgi:hypothetical protein
MAQLIVVCIIAAGVIALFVLLLKSMRGPLIKTIDEKGLTTNAGRFYPWGDLQRIEFNMLEHRVAKTKKIQSVHFYFTNGKASAGYIMKNIDAVIQKAEQLQVPKTEKVVGLYVR